METIFPPPFNGAFFLEKYALDTEVTAIDPRSAGKGSDFL
jgi:hypothetical protein